MTGMCSNLCEAVSANVRENYRAKGVLFEERAAASSILYWTSVTGQRSNQLNYVPTCQNQQDTK
jgi:hypothetical protein